MKRIFLLLMILSAAPEIAYGCQPISCSDSYSYESNDYYFYTDYYTGKPDAYSSGCDYINETCYRGGYGDVKVYSCNSCRSGYLSSYDYFYVGSGSCSEIEFNYCYLCFNYCRNTGTTWCSILNGSGARQNLGGNNCTSQGCIYGPCTVSYCNKGYYKKSINECASCATDTGVPGATSDSMNSGGISSCYIPANPDKELEDNTGFMVFDNMCYHE